jgi:transposase
MRHTESERVDDIPLIIHWLKQMQIEQLIDQELTTPHGNRQGLSYGQLSILLLTYIITQADHRLCAVEPWVNQHHRILEQATGWKISSKDATDDRLADLLAILASEQHQASENIETYLGQHLIRADELPTDQARSDTTSLSLYHQPREEKTESGQRENKALWHKGHSKDHRPDLLQYRQMLATLAPLGMPLIGATLAGNGADDPLYFPTWKRLAQLIGHLDFLFLADCKASSWFNRAQIDREGGLYCFPLAMTGHRPKLLWDWVSHPPTTVTEIFALEGKSTDSPLGQGFELPLGSLWFDKKRQKWHRWSERWLVVQSYS